VKLQLYVCPSCGRAALFNSNKLNLQGTPQRCLSDTMPLSWVHEVDLRPAPTAGWRAAGRSTASHTRWRSSGAVRRGRGPHDVLL
jgi:hypothetical protein